MSTTASHEPLIVLDDHTPGSDKVKEVSKTAIIKMRSLETLKGYHFFVDAYQRGYKWTARQVLDLLEDIYDFKVEDGIYPLQPIVTKKLSPDDTKAMAYYNRGIDVYELIDGQQRITTIFIILSLLKEYSGYFSIAYATRVGSSAFLNDISAIPILDINQPFVLKLEELEGKINLGWRSYIKAVPAGHDNPDNYHFYIAWQLISMWFRGRSQQEIDSFYRKLLHFTEVIWYEIDSSEVSEHVFMAINSGKVELTSAELIKALFLLSCKDESNTEINNLRQGEIAYEWDRIEMTMQNDEFWYFISNRNDSDDHGTRIDLLFDLVKGKKKSNTDPFFSYRQYDSDRKANKKLNWEEVKELFLKLQEWFEDRYLYHFIGYLIYTELTDIVSIIAMSINTPKDKFKQGIVNVIKKEFSRIKDGKPAYDYDELNFRDHYVESKRVLLLFNIATYLKSDANFRFPFDRLKKQSWSLEHIHSQNPRMFTMNSEVFEWANDSIRLLDDLDEPKPAEKVEDFKRRLRNLAVDNTDSGISQENMAEIEQIAESLEDFLDTHSLANLALLDRGTNSQLSNFPFIQKRDIILTIDRQGWVEVNGKRAKAFVPICTKNAFLKYYTQEIRHMTYWGYDDRRDYLKSISDTISEYLN